MQVGDEVIYVSGSYGSSKYNPLHEEYPDVVGVIVDDNTDNETMLDFSVKWSTGENNGYDEKDLRLINTGKYYNDKKKLKI